MTWCPSLRELRLPLFALIHPSLSSFSFSFSTTCSAAQAAIRTSFMPERGRHHPQRVALQTDISFFFFHPVASVHPRFTLHDG
ncbi:hypothetical protein KOW79_017362 [Hemibagrus wyckioides]|uniref:Uncharacterized protein n=1 Tax=Hemibagrus wyckioides TaxID=337641 RepID=A0A9D3SGP8_9TELE|nr:hypothetical protein KOW79_017362 [Hemibagrus wyckioides]